MSPLWWQLSILNLLSFMEQSQHQGCPQHLPSWEDHRWPRGRGEELRLMCVCVCVQAAGLVPLSLAFLVTHPLTLSTCSLIHPPFLFLGSFLGCAWPGRRVGSPSASISQGGGGGAGGRRAVSLPGVNTWLSTLYAFNLHVTFLNQKFPLKIF